METSSPTVIVGMHRSGTSLLASCLCDLGLSAPHTAEQIHAAGNPAHFEPKRVVVHNDVLLAARGGEWQYPGEQNTPPGADWSATAARLLEEVFPSSPWLLKDPRLCVLLDAWSFLPADTRFVFVNRNPLDVAASLVRRDGLSLTHGTALWDFYNAAAEAALQMRSVYVVNFEQFRAEPRGHLEELSKFLGLAARSDHEARLTVALEALDPVLGKASEHGEEPDIVGNRWSHLQGLTGAHRALDSHPFAHSVWSSDLLRVTRERDRMDRENRQLRRRPLKIAVARMTGLGRWSARPLEGIARP